jgi:hypothetical protein
MDLAATNLVRFAIEEKVGLPDCKHVLRCPAGSGGQEG